MERSTSNFARIASISSSRVDKFLLFAPLIASLKALRVISNWERTELSVVSVEKSLLIKLSNLLITEEPDSCPIVSRTSASVASLALVDKLTSNVSIIVCYFISTVSR